MEKVHKDPRRSTIEEGNLMKQDYIQYPHITPQDKSTQEVKYKEQKTKKTTKKKHTHKTVGQCQMKMKT